jgi:hypothetical protein
MEVEKRMQHKTYVAAHLLDPAAYECRTYFSTTFSYGTVHPDLDSEHDRAESLYSAHWSLFYVNAIVTHEHAKPHYTEIYV